MDNPIHLTVGHYEHGTEPVNAVIEDNIFTGSRDIGPNEPGGFAMEITRIQNAEVKNNILANTGEGAQAIGFDVSGIYRPIHRLTLHGNVLYDWNGSSPSSKRFLSVHGSPEQVKHLTLSSNQLQTTEAVTLIDIQDAATVASIESADNLYHKSRGEDRTAVIANEALSFAAWSARVGDNTSRFAAAPYPDPTRTVARYGEEALGRVPTVAVFLEAERLQRRGSWDARLSAPRVNAWIREGFRR